VTDPTRISWEALAGSGSRRTIPMVLVAGVPLVLIPRGYPRPDTAAWDTATHPLFWPAGTAFATACDAASTAACVVPWLDESQEWAFREEPDLLTGGLQADSFTLDLLDVDGAVTAALSSGDTLARSGLSASISATDTALPVVNTSVYTLSGMVSVGRETCLYSGNGGGSLTSVTRGRYGSTARAHTRRDGSSVEVVQGIASWVGRLVTLWVAELDGADALNPTLQWVGTVGPGAEGTPTRWRLKLDSIAKSAGEKIRTASLVLGGFDHRRGYLGVPSSRSPLVVQWNGNVLQLYGASAAPDSGGWHASREAFLAAMQSRCDTVAGAGNVALSINLNDQLEVLFAAPAAGESDDVVTAPWDDPAESIQHTDAAALWRSNAPMPRACFWASETVLLDDLSFAEIPATVATYDATTGSAVTPSPPVSVTTGDGTTTAGYLLRMKTAAHDELYAFVEARDATHSCVYLTPFLLTDETVDRALSSADALCTQPTTAQLGVWCRSNQWWSALRYAAQALAEIDGADCNVSAIDWDDIETQCVVHPAPVSLGGPRFVRLFPGDDSLLELIRNEARLAGFVLTTRGGRISILRMSETAPTEAGSVAIPEIDYVLAGRVKPQQSVTENPDRIVGSVKAILPGTPERSITYVAPRSSESYGHGAEVEVKLPGPLASADPGALIAAVADLGQSIAGGMDGPWRRLNLVVPLRYAGVRVGDVVEFAESLLPTTSGTHGLSGAGVVIRREFRMKPSTATQPGHGAVQLGIRLSSIALAGYAPEAPVALITANSPSAGKAQLSIDTTTVLGTSGFAFPVSETGAAVTDGGASWFRAGDKIRLVELDNTSPATPETGSVVSVTGAAIVVDFVPTLAMRALALSGPLKVAVVYDDHGTATGAHQRLYGFLARESTGLFADSTVPYRYAG